MPDTGEEMQAPGAGPHRLSRRHLLALGVGAGIGAIAPVPRTAAAAAPTRSPVGHVLPNGLVVIMEDRRSADTLALQLTARAGGRDTPDAPGLALLVSRLMFQGTGSYPSETSLQRAAALVGGEVTRGTSEETSVFTSVVPAFEAGVAFDLLSSLVLDPLLEESALARVKEIALQDLARGRASPSRLVADLFQSSIFAGHPLGTPIIGTPESIAATTRASLLQARERLWRARNLVLTIVGRLSVEDALSHAEAYFGALPPGASNERPSVPVPAVDAQRTVVGEAGQQQAQYRLGFIAPGLNHPDRYAFVLLDTLVSDYLYDELRTERGLAYFAGSDYTPYSDAGTWVAAANVDPQNVELALSLTLTIVRQLRVVPWSSTALNAAKGLMAGRQVLEQETNAARAERLSSQLTLGTQSTDEYVRRLQAVTPEDVARVAQTYLHPDRATVAIVGPRRGSGGP